jgi:hypothetical protein
MRFRFVADQPIYRSAHDRLGFDRIVRDVRSALADTETPFVYGLLGPWGSGKTSIQKLLQDAYKADLDARKAAPHLYIPIWLDAWRYENQDNMVFPLLHAFRKSRAELVPTSEVASNFLRDLRRVAASSAVAVLDLGLRTVTKAATGEAMKLKDIKEHVEDVLNEEAGELDTLLTTWAEQVESLEKNYHDFISGYAAELRETLGIQAGTEIRFVVFIDDLDRCLPSVAVAVLEGIRNHLSVPGCVYVLGINPEVIARGIRAKYAGLEVGGREYLEKILNYSFTVPVPQTEKLKSFGTAQLADLLPDPDDRDRHKDALQIFGETLAKCNFNNPRKIKRILNSYLRFLDLFPDTSPFEMADVTRLIVLAEYFVELFRHSDNGAPQRALEVVEKRLRSAEFNDTFGFPLEPMLDELSAQRELITFRKSAVVGRNDFAAHVAAVRIVCGRV